MALKSPFLPLLLFSILLPFGALLTLHRLQLLSKSVRSVRILHENNSSRPANSSSNSSLVPALFIFGDSSADCGAGIINSWLQERADHLPYGRDFDTHRPTGRFCNGRITVDYLALRLRLPFVPPWLPRYRGVQDIVHGMNYASAGAGILSLTGLNLGNRIPFMQQVGLFTETFQQIQSRKGPKEAMNIISKSVFYISIGSNDFNHFLLQNASGAHSRYWPWEFNRLLVTSIRNELKSFYDAHARRMVVMGVAPLGCAPYYMSHYRSRNGRCVEDINSMIFEFNTAMRFMVYELGRELPDANITFCDAFQGFVDVLRNHQHYGFETATNACCGFGRYGGLFMCRPELACRNASSHVWWDRFHPSDAMNAIIAENVWSGQHSKMCYPTSLKDMVS